MSDGLSHEAIAERFLQSRAVDFEAIGKFIAEIGPDLVVNDTGLHGVVFGRYNWHACLLPAADLAGLVGSLRAASLTAAALKTD
jgi:hypothetical protein